MERQLTGDIHSVEPCRINLITFIRDNDKRQIISASDDRILRGDDSAVRAGSH